MIYEWKRMTYGFQIDECYFQILVLQVNLNMKWYKIIPLDDKCYSEIQLYNRKS